MNEDLFLIVLGSLSPQDASALRGVSRRCRELVDGCVTKIAISGNTGLEMAQAAQSDEVPLHRVTRCLTWQHGPGNGPGCAPSPSSPHISLTQLRSYNRLSCT